MGHTKVVEVLLKNGANVYEKDAVSISKHAPQWAQYIIYYTHSSSK